MEPELNVNVTKYGLKAGSKISFHLGRNKTSMNSKFYKLQNKSTL